MLNFKRLIINIQDIYIEKLKTFIHKEITYEEYETLDKYTIAEKKLLSLRNSRNLIEIKTSKLFNNKKIKFI